MHTLPAAKLVGHDFLGNHIGELLIRQPTKKAAPAPRNKTSSNGSTVCGTDSATIRRASVSSLYPPSIASDASNLSDVQRATAALDSFLSVGAITPLGTSTDPIVSLEHSSESSASEPSSVDSRSGSADSDLRLHLDQLSLSHKRLASEGASHTPRVSFVTNFGAKPRRSGSRRAPSEAGSSSYFGMGSNTSSTAMSPMEPPGGISWNLPFREQHQSFAKAVEQNAMLDRNPSQHSQSSGAASALASDRMLSTPDSSLEAELATPTTSGGEAVSSVKSQSFSGAGSSQPVRQRLTRAATESILEPAAQMQRPLKSPGVPDGTSATGLSHSKSMGASSSALRTHRKKPSLVPKGSDERTFCFVEPSASETENDDVLGEEPEVAKPILTSPLARSASESSYKDVVDVQYASHVRARSAQCGVNEKMHEVATGQAVSSTLATETQQNAGGHRLDTPSSPLFPLKSLSAAPANGSTRPRRRLQIQPNVQSRPSLLEKIMQEQRVSSSQAKTANPNGVPTERASPAVTPSASEKAPESASQKAAAGEHYDPVAYGVGQRTFRIHSKAPSAGHGFPFGAISPDERERSNPPASQARTSDWARAQNLLASSPPACEDSHSSSQADFDEMQASCHSLSGLGAANQGTPTTLQHHHTVSHGSSSTDSTSLLDTRELLSPPETAISTPDLESPPEHALDSLKPSRRASPLAS